MTIPPPLLEQLAASCAYPYPYPNPYLYPYPLPIPNPNAARQGGGDACARCRRAPVCSFC